MKISEILQIQTDCSYSSLVVDTVAAQMIEML